MMSTVMVIVCVMPPPVAVMVIVWFPVDALLLALTVKVALPLPGAIMELGPNRLLDREQQIRSALHLVDRHRSPQIGDKARRILDRATPPGLVIEGDDLPLLWLAL